MQIYDRNLYKLLIICQSACLFLFSVEGSSAKYSNNSLLTSDNISFLNQDDIKETSRNKRQTKPFTEFFDNLLGERLFNTTMNFIVPGAEVNLPRHTEEGSVDHLAMQAFFGIFWAAAWLATIAIPVTNTYFQPLGIGRSVEDDTTGFHLKWKFHLNEKVADAIGLNWKPCMEKSICQAHEFPEKYGTIGKVIQVIFPVDDKLDDNMIHHAPSLHEDDFNDAIGHDCIHKHKCFFDILDVIIYVKNHCFVTLSKWL